MHILDDSKPQSSYTQVARAAENLDIYVSKSRTYFSATSSITFVAFFQKPHLQLGYFLCLGLKIK